VSWDWRIIFSSVFGPLALLMAASPITASTSKAPDERRRRPQPMEASSRISVPKGRDLLRYLRSSGRSLSGGNESAIGSARSTRTA